MFITDRDLAVLEPGLGRDVAWAGQTLARGTGTLSGRTVMIPSMRAFDAGVRAGMLLVLGGATFEIISVDSDETVLVSSMRDSALDEARVPPGGVPPAPASIVTFGPQIQTVHRQILWMLGVSEYATADRPPGDPRVGRERITNPRDLALLEALGTLHLIYAGAEALLGADSVAAAKARVYRDRFNRERWRAAALIDTDGDGVPDATRRMNVSVLTRG